VLWLFDPRRTLSIACRRPTRAPTPKPADSSGSLHLAALDTLRAVSVLWLVAFHTYFVGRAVLNKTAGMEAVAGYAWAGPIVQGHYSVDGFLVVSGFLITRVIRREQRRRGARCGD
jgi:peptidoglycan/LPS O-acetylase OafA/YrhL